MAGRRHATTFNVGLAPVDAEILLDPTRVGDALQIQLYAELLSLAGLDAEAWRPSAVIEVAAGCDVGLLYLSRRHRPLSAIGVDASAVAAWQGRWLGIDLRQGEATRLPFEDRHFNCLVCVDTLNYFVEAEFMSEAMRLLKPSGRLLRDTLRDVSEGARQPLRERSPRASRAVVWVAPFLRRSVREMLIVEGSERYRRWQAGEYCFEITVLRRQAVES